MHCTWLSPLLTHSHAFDSRVSQAHGPWRGRGGPVTRFRASNDLRDRNSCAVRASLGKRRRQMYRHSTSSALPARLRGEQSVLHRDVCSVIHENTSSSMLNLFGLSLDTRQRGVSLTVDEPRLRSARRRRSRDATSRTVRSTHYCILCVRWLFTHREKFQAIYTLGLYVKYMFIRTFEHNQLRLVND